MATHTRLFLFGSVQLTFSCHVAIYMLLQLLSGLIFHPACHEKWTVVKNDLTAWKETMYGK